MDRSSTGLKREAAAAMSYVLGPLTGIIFIILEKDDFVRFHAMQSIFVLGGIALFAFLLWAVPIVSSLLWLAYVLVLIIGALKASQGERWEVPILGKFIRKMSS